MALNCEAGDLAVFVRPMNPLNQDAFVNVLEPIGWFESEQRFVSPDGRTWHVEHAAFYWWCEAHSMVYLIDFPPAKRVPIRDSALRPIRPQPDDAQDETLLWKPVPARRAPTALSPATGDSK